jgi:hypothetical protein
MSDGDGVVRDGVGDIEDGVRDLVLGDVENRGGDGVKEAYVPIVITPEMRESLNRHWFKKRMEGGSPPSILFLNQ